MGRMKSLMEDVSLSHAGFVHLRVHTAYSLSEGAIPVKKLLGLCQKYDMPAVAITDTSNLFGSLEMSLSFPGGGVQPIMGCQIALSRQDGADRALYHQLLDTWSEVVSEDGAALSDADRVVGAVLLAACGGGGFQSLNPSSPELDRLCPLPELGAADVTTSASSSASTPLEALFGPGTPLVRGTGHFGRFCRRYSATSS